MLPFDKLLRADDGQPATLPYLQDFCAKRGAPTLSRAPRRAGRRNRFLSLAPPHSIALRQRRASRAPQSYLRVVRAESRILRLRNLLRPVSRRNTAPAVRSIRPMSNRRKLCSQPRISIAQFARRGRPAWLRTERRLAAARFHRSGSAMRSARAWNPEWQAPIVA